MRTWRGFDGLSTLLTANLLSFSGGGAMEDSVEVFFGAQALVWLSLWLFRRRQL